jgi:hypothetical protein
MKAKIVVCILLVVACLCLLTVYGVSQTNYPPQPTGPIPSPVPGFDASPQQLPGSTPTLPREGRLEQLVQQLTNVRQQKMALEAQEEELLKRIDVEVEEQRKALQKAEELRKQIRQENLQKGAKAIQRRGPVEMPKKMEEKKMFEGPKKMEEKEK